MRGDYGLESAFVRQLDEEIAAFVAAGLDHRDEAGFNRLALAEFELQYHTVHPYRDFCRRLGRTPETVTRWSEIPPVPSLAFKRFVLTTFPPEVAVQSYMSSGTTDPTRRARVYRDRRAVELMVAANALLARSYLFPDVERMRILFFAPSPRLVPGMGMAVGLGEVERIFGAAGSAFLVGRRGLDLELLLTALREAEATGRPLALVGATSALIYFFAACEREGLRFVLPPGSRVCDGGGYQGQFGECSTAEFWERCRRVLGVPETHCVNVLGMAETSTNYFDNVLRNHLDGVERPRYKELPPWTRLAIIDPETLEPVAPGEAGLLCHYDLTNRAQMFAVQTDNVGLAVEDGFEILGRWRKRDGRVYLDRTFRHPGGPVVNKLTEFLLRRRLDRIGRVHARLAAKA
ncbi:acyl-protein synthetase [Dissulfurirhabdus thermomarina]|uniref:Acyl-protein synthetase n=1 Tax=Dissulfurirhabdus thermomarina TaxID=1765737 RepID=A0A6N9TN75_DISTH|nr:acyl-protein synthetase [Dissulfurirhabdus thermomarina]NDY41890.1 acyl-protein synthetase [Dissulfurirhabdus thermomarina]NMX23706.1 acyl-protein synthetase [Dissulfurirhabdus thermomarina]